MSNLLEKRNSLDVKLKKIQDNKKKIIESEKKTLSEIEEINRKIQIDHLTSLGKVLEENNCLDITPEALNDLIKNSKFKTDI